MTIRNSDGEVIGVVQAINKNPMGTPFTDDEKVRICYGSPLEKHVSDPRYEGNIHISLYFTGFVSSSLLLQFDH